MLTGNQLITLACEAAHSPGKTAYAALLLQAILDELCLKSDFALARGVYYFSLNPTLITTLGGITNYGGPYPLPLDYLRTSGSSGSEGVQAAFFYVYNGVPYPLLPLDLGKLDQMVQQPGTQNLPYAFATDISPETTAQDRIAGTTTAATTIGNANITVASATNIVLGMSMSGLGIAAGSTVLNIASTTITLSLAATGTFAAAAVMFGTPANAYVYPGPSGAFSTTLRYQRLMPPLVDMTRVPWFPDQVFLIKRLTADLMMLNDDSRYERFVGESQAILGKYEAFSDDKTNRAQRVILDRNRFGNRFERLPNTKTVGWTILLCAILPSLLGG